MLICKGRLLGLSGPLRPKAGRKTGESGPFAAEEAEADVADGEDADIDVADTEVSEMLPV